ncbi:MAG TPA: sulfite exporter TauE/SafE family protein [Candidatus Poseidoniales archaeon]|nr:MAG: hypothetical protein CXT65_01385 [Euryarchaeota archaeon]HIG38815.1 sulfite exporter TauE/SafE family protein [Candidatus Poseidoniales archaeon]HIL43573.1 sulfite exporter TauE/SafE family protein [Candidatus Poseidoniales archaeon]
MLSSEMWLILAGLFIVAALYSSVGHGGGSGYLAILSLTSYGSAEAVWLKQYAWSLNLIVAGLAFWHYYKAGHHDWSRSLPFIVASVPLAALGGYMSVGGDVYDLLLSAALVVAAWRLFVGKWESGGVELPEKSKAVAVGGGIGLASGVVGIGGGIFLSPVMMLNNWATAKQTAATAALFIWLNSLAGLIGSGLSGQVGLDLDLLGSFGVVVMLGGVLGSRYGSKISSQNGIRGLLVLVLCAAAARRLLSVMGI